VILHTRLLFWANGFTVSPSLILINWTGPGLDALIAHEQCHQEQMRRDGLLTFWWRYLTSRAHRLDYEACAYNVQISMGYPVEWAAEKLVAKYFLNITLAQATAALELRSHG